MNNDTSIKTFLLYSMFILQDIRPDSILDILLDTCYELCRIFGQETSNRSLT